MGQGPIRRHKTHKRGLLKHGRSFRWGGNTHSLSKYRLRHGIPAGSRKDNHAKGLCPAHSD